MKVLQLGGRVGRRTLAFGNVSLSRSHGVPAVSYVRTAVRCQSSSERAPKATQWTPHSLNDFQSHSVGNDTSPHFSKKTPTVHTAYIALGSNLGDRIGWIEKACKHMSSRGLKIKRTSCLWETEPMYVVDQGSFINGVCEVETTLSPLTLLDMLQSIEKTLGRKKIIDKGPRNIDLDILLFDDQVIDHERLKVPHPGILEREFVLRPLAELIPARALDPASPWKVTQDYLNALPPSMSPISTLTPLNPWIEPIRAMKSTRQTHVMAIVNLTPDSFSDGGVNLPADGKEDDQKIRRLYDRTLAHADNGATIIDIGGQSTAPGTVQVTDADEISRILPFVQELNDRPRFRKKIAISIDTYRSAVAEALDEIGIEGGIDIINDVSAGQMDPNMLSTVARLGKTVVLMHMRGTPETMNSRTAYPEGLIPTIAKELLKRVAEAEAAGVYRWRIILDPGIGFAKNQEQNLEILRRFDELRDSPGLRGLPWLLGSSRKNFVGKITGVKEPSQRVWGTAATVAAAVQGGADIVRVHDVEKMAQVVKMSDAIWRV
ncbi:folic acid synthesis protein-like protein [Stipitochalara longipes BDJ]|nr:folic acid synthesis protein-like protein [Stipitochalara longipes BDJ]